MTGYSNVPMKSLIDLIELVINSMKITGTT